MKCFDLRHFLLVLVHTQLVLSCPRIYHLCCSDYIPNQLPENARFDDPDILYTEPEITASTDCSKATADCTLLGFDSGYYNLLFSDENNKIKKVIEATNPVFELDCGTGENNYISCEHGCNPEKCPPTGNCTSCDMGSLIKPRNESNFMKPHEFHPTVVNGCYEFNVYCHVPNWASCNLKFLGVTENSETILIGESDQVLGVWSKVQCNGLGKVESNGQVLESVYCSYDACAG